MALLACLAVVGVFRVFDPEMSRWLSLDRPFSRPVVTWGYYLGHGTVQVLFLAALYALGRLSNRTGPCLAAASGLVAYAISGVGVQVVKHLVGRPRPRLYVEGVRHFGPSLQGGLDSFPSGHTSTSVALAVALSFHWPRGAPFFLGIAALVAASRLLGGSHFPTDVWGGVILGMAAGWAATVWLRRRRATASAKLQGGG